MNDNNKLIFELIKNHFGYTEKSLTYIESQLENHISSEYINELFSGFSDERVYYPISLEYKEKIDEGWVIFKKYFMDFASSHEMKYLDFVENKVVINKNSLKLKKALVAYYIKKRSEQIVKGALNLNKANNMMLMKNTITGNKELLYDNGATLKFLQFNEMDKGFEFICITDIALMNGTKRLQHPTMMLSALSLSSDIQVKASQCNRILFTKNDGDEECVSFYVNKLSEGGLNFFRRQKLSIEQSNKYFSNKTFLTTTNDERTIKLFYINDNRYFCHVTFLINQESGELTFSEEVVTDLKIEDGIKSFSVIVKEKHSELFLSSCNYDIGKSNMMKYITENGVNFVATFQDFKTCYSSSDAMTLFSKEYVYSLRDGYFIIYYFASSKNEVPEEVRKAIEDDINKKLEVIGTKSLPKNKEISVVISKNFADWLLCSTAETWSSCLNLESNHSSCHWQGLPALLGDPNRIMFYITDGTKKTYKGIVVDKILSRTWGLLDGNNKFNAIKFYPLELLEMTDLYNITKIPSILIDRKFVSKDPIHPIFYKYSDRFECSSFIFQDKTQFVGMSDGYHLSFGSCNGYYSIVKDLEKNKESIKPIGLFEYTHGFTFIKDRGEKLTSYYKNLFLSDERCNNCGNRLREGQQSYAIEGEGTLCPHCFNEYHFYCHICHNIHDKRDLNAKVTNNGGENVFVCKNCFDHIAECSNCGIQILKEMVIKYRDEENKKLDLCCSCFENRDEAADCKMCGTFFHKDVVEQNKLTTDFRDNIFCGKCLFEISDRKQIKFGFYVE